MAILRVFMLMVDDIVLSFDEAESRPPLTKLQILESSCISVLQIYTNYAGTHHSQ